MKKDNTGFLFPLIALIVLIFGLSSRMFDIPPVGKTLDPFIGFIQNDQDKSLDAPLSKISMPGLTDTVKVFFDERKVPHIYAANTADLYFAQGYITALLRLWQMDFLSYVAGGRLSEIFDNPAYLEYDRSARRMGLLEAAKQSLNLIAQDTLTKKVIASYTRGVNAYISKLKYKELPLEYKLLDYEPEPWSDLKTVLVLKQMGNTLTGYEEDMVMSKLMLLLGEENFNKLYPDFQYPVTPVMDDVKTRTGDQAWLKKPDYLSYSFLNTASVISKSQYNPRLGSNSWAVSGKKTRSGFPMLACDPHLGLSLPSVWIEMQLVCPGMNVYGVSIPGTPAIIIGFNNKIAWGITNGADDVKDWYKLKISNNYKKYELNGNWVDFNCRVEEIKRKGQKIFYDTIYSSVHGPIVYNKSFPGKQPEFADYALKWELHNPSNEFLTFIKLNVAGNFTEYKEAIKTYRCPTLNFTFAGPGDTIAVFHQGNMAVKLPGAGKFILDGTNSSQIPSRYIPVDSLPHSINPPCNYVVSANQHPTYPNYAYYYNGYYAETRANEIATLLVKNDLDIKAMEAMQLNNTNSFAVEALPVLMKTLDEKKLTPNQQKMFIALQGWNGSYDLNDENARLFSLWWNNISDYTWDELKKYSFSLINPKAQVLLQLIQHEPFNAYFDKLETRRKENGADIITEAFIAASDEYSYLQKQGETKWGDFNKVSIMHITNMPVFSVRELQAAGHPDAINATSNNWGPSWRMIVELGEQPKAYGIYPGGQSGNVGSLYYKNSVDDWNKGKYYPLHFFTSMNEAAIHCHAQWVLK